MNEKPSRMHPISYAIVILVALNLLVSVAILYHLADTTSRPKGLASDNIALPDGLKTQGERMGILERIKEIYNEGSNEELRDMLDPVVRLQQSDEEFDLIVNEWKKSMGKIVEGAYYHYEVLEASHDLRTYRLYYRLKAEKGNALFTLTVGQQGNEDYRIVALSFARI